MLAIPFPEMAGSGKPLSMSIQMEIKIESRFHIYALVQLFPALPFSDIKLHPQTCLSHVSQFFFLLKNKLAYSYNRYLNSRFKPCVKIDSSPF